MRTGQKRPICSTASPGTVATSSLGSSSSAKLASTVTGLKSVKFAALGPCWAGLAQRDADEWRLHDVPVTGEGSAKWKDRGVYRDIASRPIIVGKLNSSVRRHCKGATSTGGEIRLRQAHRSGG